MGGYGRPPARSATDGGQAPVGKHCIKMRGLPYRASERDIIDVSPFFFTPTHFIILCRFSSSLHCEWPKFTSSPSTAAADQAANRASNSSLI